MENVGLLKHGRGCFLSNFRKMLLVIFLVACMPWQLSPAAAQDSGGAALKLAALDTSLFPNVSFRLEALDTGGSIPAKLKPQDIKILENGKAFRPDRLVTAQNPLQITAVLNTHSSMANYIDGAPQYDYIEHALLEWIRSKPEDTPDDFSLATFSGVNLVRSRSPEAWEKGLLNNRPDLLKASPNLNAFADALDLATDPVKDPSTRRVILFITAPLPPSQITTLPDLTDRARQTGARVFVWFIAPSNREPDGNEESLRQLAEQTGGQFSQLYPPNGLPDFETPLAPLRQAYVVHYSSKVKESGTHRVSVEIQQGNETLTSNESSFTLHLLPPNPIFLSPPVSVEREWTVPESENEEPVLTPDEYALNILIEFPDQRQRPLKATRLYVNGELIAENSEAPFDQFRWPLSHLSEPRQHLLRVEAEDNLGLIGSSLEIPVEVLVTPKPQPPGLIESIQISGENWIALGAVFLSGAALAFVLVKSGGPKRFITQQKAFYQNIKDAITVPSRANVERARARGEHEAPTWPRSSSADGTLARLISLSEHETPIPGGAIPLIHEEITFGSDPARATQVIESPTVDPLHARLYRDEQGNFYLADLGSVAGTWINYAPVTSHGAHLEHADLIHIGRVIFRFELTDLERARRPEIKVEHLEEHSQ